MGKLDGKVIIITGGASGLGKSEVMRCVDEGAKVAFCDIREDKLEETKKICEERGGEVLACICDVTVAEQREAFVKAVVDRFGTIDVLVNNAHKTTKLKPFLEKTLDELEDEVKCCIYAYFHFCQLCVPYMKDKFPYGASIINFGSKAAREGTPNHSVYATVKAAVGGLTRTLARELGKHNIRVNTLMPGGFTDNIAEGLKYESKEVQDWYMHAASKDKPFGRHGDPYEDVAPGVVFLASDESRWVTGNYIQVDGGSFIAG